LDSAGFISQKGVGATRCIDKRKYFKYGSIEDGAVELGIPLIFVMGHEKCQPATLQPCNPATARRFEI
jgi:hypothetical protein